MLPFGAQQTFDEVVSVVIPAEPGSDDARTITDDGTEGDDVTDDRDGDATEGYDPAEGNFGSWVSEQAKDKPDTGKNFGEMVSDEAHNKPHPGATDESEVAEEGDDESDSDEVSHGNGSRSDTTPAPGKKAR